MVGGTDSDGRLVRVHLGASGRSHIRERLGVDGRPWGKAMRDALSRLDVDSGSVWTWASSDFVPDHESLHYASLPPGATLAAQWELLSEFVVQYLMGPERLALIEHDLAKSSDPWLKNEPELPPYLVSGEDVYWYADRPD